MLCEYMDAQETKTSGPCKRPMGAVLGKRFIKQLRKRVRRPRTT